MILLFSSNIDGGILQLAIQLLSEINALNIDCKCMIPEGAKVSIPENLRSRVVFYKKIKSFSKKSELVLNLAYTVMHQKPDVVWYVDASILSSEVCCCLSGKVKQYITIHDPAEDHPTNSLPLKERAKRFLVKKYRRESTYCADKVIVLSKESFHKFAEYEPKLKEKTEIFTLGAHVPDIGEIMPEECSECEDGFLLFFGRIDKYKGIENLLTAYEAWKNKKLTLVIAGKGTFTEKERELLGKVGSIKLINRYIEDGEMIWLFKHAKASVLPYIEASQSGIIPISYMFGVPVITSDVKGLTQFVVQGSTGFVCTTTPEYDEAFSIIADEKETKFKDNCIHYYFDHMEWEQSLKKLFNKILE